MFQQLFSHNFSCTCSSLHQKEQPDLHKSLVVCVLLSENVIFQGILLSPKCLFWSDVCLIATWAISCLFATNLPGVKVINFQSCLSAVISFSFRSTLQNILRKIKKSSKVRQDLETLTSVLVHFLRACAKYLFKQEILEARLCPYVVWVFHYYFLIFQDSTSYVVRQLIYILCIKFHMLNVKSVLPVVNGACAKTL